MSANINHCTHCARYLLQAGADPNIASSTGDAAIHFPSMYDGHAILHQLLAGSANCSAKIDPLGATPRTPPIGAEHINCWGLLC